MNASRNLYLDTIAAMTRARKEAEGEFEERISQRAGELSRDAENDLIQHLKELSERGVTVAEIRLEVFAGNTAQAAVWFARAGLTSGKRGRPRKPFEHGKYGSYTRGCRCDPCTKAASDYQRSRTRRLKEKEND